MTDKTPKEAFGRVIKLALTFSNEVRHELAKAYAEYLETLPPEHRDLTVVFMTDKGSISVRRSEIPRRIVEDPEFCNLFLQYLSKIAAKR